MDEIVFVGMRPFYGLNLYLDKHIEGIEIDERRFNYSTFVTPETSATNCSEHERNVYGHEAHRGSSNSWRPPANAAPTRRGSGPCTATATTSGLSRAPAARRLIPGAPVDAGISLGVRRLCSAVGVGTISRPARIRPPGAGVTNENNDPDRCRPAGYRAGAGCDGRVAQDRNITLPDRRSRATAHARTDDRSSAPKSAGRRPRATSR